MALDLKSWTTVDGRNPANRLRLAVYPIIYKVLYIPGGAGFLPSTVSTPDTWPNGILFHQPPPFPWFFGGPISLYFSPPFGGPNNSCFGRDEIFDQDLMMVKPSPGWTINLKWVGWICSINSLVKHTKLRPPLSFPADNTRTRGSSWCGIVQVSNLENHLHVHLRYSIITPPEVEQWIPWKVTISQKDRIHSKPSSFRGYMLTLRFVHHACFWNRGSMASLRICIYTHQLKHLEAHVRILWF